MLLMRETLHKQPSFAHFLGNYSIISMLLMIKADMGITRVQIQFLDELYSNTAIDWITALAVSTAFRQSAYDFQQ